MRLCYTGSELFPYGRDGREFYDIVANMVGSYVDVFYESDDDVLQDTELPAFWAGKQPYTLSQLMS